jgi:hypothetical protein
VLRKDIDSGNLPTESGGPCKTLIAEQVKECGITDAGVASKYGWGASVAAK